MTRPAYSSSLLGSQTVKIGQPESILRRKGKETKFPIVIYLYRHMLSSMNLTDLKSSLRQHPDKLLQFVLPDGDVVPAQFHVTEVGHVAKNFIDCGGVKRRSEVVQLQVWLGNDLQHRLTAGKLIRILDLAKDFIPTDQLEVEVEYEDCAISQYPLETVELAGEHFKMSLGLRHTDCLAKEACGIEPASCCGDRGCGN